MILGIGVDIVQVDRLRKSIERYGERFLRRIFTEREVRYCLQCARPQERFATRFAAKEAVLKALGTGWQRGASFAEVEVRTDDLGAPAIVLKGKTLEISRGLGIERIHISLSHDQTYAVANAVAEGRSGAAQS